MPELHSASSKLDINPEARPARADDDPHGSSAGQALSHFSCKGHRGLRFHSILADGVQPMARKVSGQGRRSDLSIRLMRISAQRNAALWVIVFLLALLVQPPVRGQSPEQSCNDPIPKVCATAKFLGQDKGCACFVCNLENKDKRKVVCTRLEADKQALFKISGQKSAADRPDAPVAGR